MKIACSFLDFLNEQRGKKQIFFKLLADEKCVVILLHEVTNFTYEIEVSTTSIKTQLGVYYEMMV